MDLDELDQLVKVFGILIGTIGLGVFLGNMLSDEARKTMAARRQRKGLPPQP